MTVTKIEPMTKTRYKVYLDGQFAFVLYKGELSRYHIEEETELEDAAYAVITKLVLKRAKLRAMHLLNDMGRTESQLRTKLLQGGYTENITEEAIQYVKSFGYINDLEYARNYILGRKSSKSKWEIYAGLGQKGLSGEIISQAMEECYEEDDVAEAILSLMKKRRFDPENADEQSRQKMIGYLARKGFGYSDIQHVMLDIFHKTV